MVLMTVVFHGMSWQGITVYHNSSPENGNSFSSDAFSPGSGHIVIGRKTTNEELDYSSVLIDELTLWNWNFTADDVNVMLGT